MFKNTGKILCVDPGATHSGVAFLENGMLRWSDSAMPNGALLEKLKYLKDKGGAIAMEEFESYKLAIGQPSVQTIFWSGRFYEASGWPVELFTRKEVKIFMLGRVGVKNSKKATRDALLTLYPADGGGKTPQIGTKRKPGPLYGLTGHAVSAMEVGITMIGKRHYLNRLSDFKQIQL